MSVVYIEESTLFLLGLYLFFRSDLVIIIGAEVVIINRNHNLPFSHFSFSHSSFFPPLSQPSTACLAVPVLMYLPTPVKAQHSAAVLCLE